MGAPLTRKQLFSPLHVQGVGHGAAERAIGERRADDAPPGEDGRGAVAGELPGVEDVGPIDLHEVVEKSFQCIPGPF